MVKKDVSSKQEMSVNETVSTGMVKLETFEASSDLDGGVSVPNRLNCLRRNKPGTSAKV